jgi:hypothetical protein
MPDPVFLGTVGGATLGSVGVCLSSSRSGRRPTMSGSALAARGVRSLLGSFNAVRPGRGGGDVAAVPSELAGLDWSVIACQCGHGCSRPARFVAEFHAVDYCGCSEVNDAGNLVAILCGHCVSMLWVSVAVYARRLSRWGRPACQACGAPIATVGDVLRAVRPL